MAGKRSSGFNLREINKFLQNIKETAPELVGLIGTLVGGGQKVDPEQLFNKAVYYVRQAIYNDPYYILGVSKDDPKELMEKVYKLKAKHYHPDKGGDQEKFVRLRDAWARIKSERGW